MTSHEEIFGSFHDQYPSELGGGIGLGASMGITPDELADAYGQDGAVGDMPPSDRAYNGFTEDGGAGTSNRPSKKPCRTLPVLGSGKIAVSASGHGGEIDEYYADKLATGKTTSSYGEDEAEVLGYLDF